MSTADPRPPRHPLARVGKAAAILVLVAGAAALVTLSPIPGLLADPDRLRAAVLRIGPFGPIAIVAGLALAVVVTPIPSAPIAVVAGALYGKVWGTVYVIAGAELGAMTAFGLARHFGFDAARRWPAVARLLDGVTSQGRLAMIVFVSRLMPFVSFDAVSYAAGLTRLRWTPFALATVTGVAPVSLLLVWFGEATVTSAPGDALRITLLAGGVTLVPLAFALARRVLRHAEHHAGPPRKGDGPAG